MNAPIEPLLRRAVFLDKDGTLIEDVPFNVDPDRIRLTPGAVQGMRLLHEADFALVVVSNQAGVARGFFPEQALVPVRQRLTRLLQECGVTLAGFYYCPHHPDGTLDRYRRVCLCRKPAPGLVVQAAQDLCLDLRRSWFVGDILDDIETGRRAGCRTILLDRGSETEWRRGPLRRPHFVVTDLAEAARIIVRAQA